MPRFFLFSRPTFADPISRLTFATPFRDSHSRPPLTTHIRDPLSRLTFTTPLATPLHDSRSRPHLRLSFATPDRAPNCDSLFLSRLPSYDSTTDGRTVLTPQRHLPSVPTLTLIKKFGTYSLACPPPLAPTHHHVHTPQWLCVP